MPDAEGSSDVFGPLTEIQVQAFYVLCDATEVKMRPINGGT